MMVDFKVGDRVRLNEKCRFIGGQFGYSVGSVGTITADRCQSSLEIEMLYPINGYETLYCFSHELDLVNNFPPATITHEGYTYTRGERVLPDWVKDGAWVVSRASGTIVEIVSASDNFVRARAIGADMQMRYTPSDFPGLFRPFTAKDWKWGMWAMYEGKRVFVIGCVEDTGMIGVSSLNLDKDGSDSFDKNYGFILPSELTPTF